MFNLLCFNLLCRLFTCASSSSVAKAEQAASWTFSDYCNVMQAKEKHGMITHGFVSLTFLFGSWTRTNNSFMRGMKYTLSSYKHCLCMHAHMHTHTHTRTSRYLYHLSSITYRGGVRRETFSVPPTMKKKNQTQTKKEKPSTPFAVCV